MGCFKRTASKHVYYQGWNRSPAQVGCMRQALGPGALGGTGGSGWSGRWEGGSWSGIHVNSRTFHFNVWQNSLQKKKKRKKKYKYIHVCVKTSRIKKKKEKKIMILDSNKNFIFWFKKKKKKKQKSFEWSSLVSGQGLNSSPL